MTGEPRGHVFPKWGPRGPFRVYSWTQAAVTVFGLVSAALMLVAGMGAPALLLVVVLGAMTLRDPTGTPAWTRVGLGLRYLATGWTGRRRWIATDDRPRPAWLANVEVSACALSFGVMGVMKDRGRYLAAMRVSPTRDPWLQSESDREVAADDWARVLTSLPIETADRLQVITISRKGGGDQLLTDASLANGPGLEVLKEVAGYLADHVRNSDTVLVVRLAHTSTRDALKRGGEEAVGRLLHSVLQHLGSQMPSEQVHAEILAPLDWTTLLGSILELDVDRVDTLDGVPCPRLVEERWNSVRVGETVHRVLWMWQWPQRPMASGFLAPLLTGGGNRVVSILVGLAEPETHQRSLDWSYRRAQAAVETAKSSRHRKQAEMDSLDRQLRELNEGHVPVRVLTTIGLSGPTEVEVEDLTGMVRSNAVAGSCRVATMGGGQLRSFPWVLPLCRGLDRGVDG